MKTINAKGKGLDPVMMVKMALDRGDTELEVLLDDPVSASNVVRFIENRGFCVSLKDDEGAISISARKTEQSIKAAAFKKNSEDPASETQYAGPQEAPLHPSLVPESPGTFSVLITCLALGRDQALGEALMKGFLGALSKMERPPLVVALMSEGVKLTLYDSSHCDHLKNLEKKGASILICGTSANYFNITDQIGVGSISNMCGIIEALNKADKIMTI